MKIAVIGDHCLDIDYVGEYDGLMSREIERLPVFNCSSVRYSGGGAADIVELLAELGVTVIPIGAYGGIEGEILMDKVWQAHEETWDKDQTVDWMIEGQPTPSFIKYYQKSGQHTFRMNKKAEPLKPEIESQLIENIEQLKVDAIIVADYDETGNGIVTFDILDAIIKRPGLKFGTSRTAPERFIGYNYIVVNEREYLAKPIQSEYTGGKIVITQGEIGSFLVETKQYEHKILESESITLKYQLTKDIDICGCGDSFLSAFVIKKLDGLSDLECLRWGNAAGRAQARKLYGAHTLTWEEIRKEYSELYGSSKAQN